jgi:hypothetical protein
MTHAIALVAGTLAGSAITAAALAAVYRRRLEEAGWRADVPDSTGVVPVAPEVVRQLARRADSAERRARRWGLAVNALQDTHRYIVGDLLDAVRARDARIRRLSVPRHVRRSPVPIYGAQRARARAGVA